VNKERPLDGNSTVKKQILWRVAHSGQKYIIYAALLLCSEEIRNNELTLLPEIKPVGRAGNAVVRSWQTLRDLHSYFTSADELGERFRTPENLCIRERYHCMILKSVLLHNTQACALLCTVSCLTVVLYHVDVEIIQELSVCIYRRKISERFSLSCWV
jgi:hypothetical protein